MYPQDCVFDPCRREEVHGRVRQDCRRRYARQSPQASSWATPAMSSERKRRELSQVCATFLVGSPPVPREAHDRSSLRAVSRTILGSSPFSEALGLCCWSQDRLRRSCDVGLVVAAIVCSEWAPLRGRTDRACEESLSSLTETTEAWRNSYKGWQV